MGRLNLEHWGMRLKDVEFKGRSIFHLHVKKTFVEMTFVNCFVENYVIAFSMQLNIK